MMIKMKMTTYNYIKTLRSVLSVDLKCGMNICIGNFMKKKSYVRTCLPLGPPTLLYYHLSSMSFTKLSIISPLQTFFFSMFVKFLHNFFDLEIQKMWNFFFKFYLIRIDYFIWWFKHNYYFLRC